MIKLLLIFAGAVSAAIYLDTYLAKRRRDQFLKEHRAYEEYLKRVYKD